MVETEGLKFFEKPARTSGWPRLTIPHVCLDTQQSSIAWLAARKKHAAAWPAIRCSASNGRSNILVAVQNSFEYKLFKPFSLGQYEQHLHHILSTLRLLLLLLVLFFSCFCSLLFFSSSDSWNTVPGTRHYVPRRAFKWCTHSCNSTLCNTNSNVDLKINDNVNADLEVDATRGFAVLLLFALRLLFSLLPASAGWLVVLWPLLQSISACALFCLFLVVRVLIVGLTISLHFWLYR